MVGGRLLPQVSLTNGVKYMDSSSKAFSVSITYLGYTQCLKINPKSTGLFGPYKALPPSVKFDPDILES